MSWENILKGPEIPDDFLDTMWGHREMPGVTEEFEIIKEIVKDDPSEFISAKIVRGHGAQGSQKTRWGRKGRGYRPSNMFVVEVSPNLETATVKKLREAGFAVSNYHKTTGYKSQQRIRGKGVVDGKPTYTYTIRRKPWEPQEENR